MSEQPSNPAEHYAAAESLLAELAAKRGLHDEARTIAIRAQAHATLATVPLAVAEAARNDWDEVTDGLEMLVARMKNRPFDEFTGREVAQMLSEAMGLEGVPADPVVAAFAALPDRARDTALDSDVSNR